MAHVSIQHVDKVYNNREHVLKDLSLEVSEGEFLVLLGPSGCGKTTLLNCVAGLIELEGGSIYIGGQDMTDLDPKDRNIAMVFQSYALYPTKTARGNLSFGLRMKGLPKKEIEQRVQWAAELLQITELLDRKPSQLSGGQRQRVAIGRALVRQAAVFLFDEPLSNLDAKLRTEMRFEIKKLHKILNSTIIYVTHDQVEAMTLATKIAVMDRGIFQQIASPEELYDYPENMFVARFIGAPGMNFLPATIQKNGNIAARLADKSLLPLQDYPFRVAPQDGQQVVVGIRPEHFSSHLNDGVALDLPIELYEPLGSETLVYFTMASQSVAARLEPDFVKQHKDRGSLPVFINTRKISLFDHQTEVRL
jgi:multiple sugar transport system ATP-binding protein